MLAGRTFVIAHGVQKSRTGKDQAGAYRWELLEAFGTCAGSEAPEPLFLQAQECQQERALVDLASRLVLAGSATCLVLVVAAGKIGSARGDYMTIVVD
jgi:hypothetical protein